MLRKYATSTYSNKKEKKSNSILIESHSTNSNTINEHQSKKVSTESFQINDNKQINRDKCMNN
jgi:hypothetical protein